MRILLVLIASLLLLGCASEAPLETSQSTGETIEENKTVTVEETEETTTETQEEDDDVPGIIEVPEQEEVIKDKSGTPAQSQADCSTLSPDCATCVAQENCGWCKSRNGCFYGDSSGPAPGIADCPAADWAYSEAECAGPKGGTTCEENWNCADCLSGSGCKWCQEGTKCRDMDSTESCGTGGWRTISYQCYAGQ